MAGVDLLPGNQSTHIRQSRLRWQFVRRATVLVVGCGILLATWRRFGVQGIVFPVRIASGSMAETLVGPHWLVTCAHCHFQFSSGVDHPPADTGATCPNCGFSHNRLAPNELRPGDRVVIDRWTYLWRAPSRYDLVALRSPDGQGDWAVKRILGLPGETVAIREGDVYINDQPLRKSWPLLAEMAVTIHDDRHRPTDATADSLHWQPGHAASGWHCTADGYNYASSADFHSTRVATHAADWDWLVYRHQSGLPPPTISDVDALWLDNDPYNQSLSRPLHRIHDVLLSFQVRNPDQRPIAVALTTNGHEFLIAWRPDLRQWELTESSEFNPASTNESSGQQNARVLYDWPPGENRVTCQVAYCDHQVLLIVNGQILIKQTIGPSPPTHLRQPCAVRIGASRGSLHVGAIRLARDIYYTPAPTVESRSDSVEVLGPAQYLVLGDNSPASVDGREWGPVSMGEIIGRVVRWQR